jgi:hypothetical protein
MKGIQDKVSEFFSTRPNATECYEALGRIFGEKDKAQKFLSGVAGRYVTTHTREGMNFERESDNLKYQIAQQNNFINEKHKAYEAASATDKEKAMGEWNKAQADLLKLQQRLEKQLDLEQKEELTKKEEKPAPDGIERPLYTAADLKVKVSNQQAIVDANEKLIETLTGKKKTRAQKVQKDEVKLLDDLKAQLEEAIAEEAGADQTNASDVKAADETATTGDDTIDNTPK